MKKGIVFVNDILDDNGNFLEYTAFLNKYNLNCTHREYHKVSKAIPLPLIQMMRNTMLYSRIRPIPTLQNLVINNCKLYESKCSNKFINQVLKSKVFPYCNRGLCVQVQYMKTLWMDKSHFKFTKWPISPKVKETHFKIIYKIYPVADFLRKRFKSEGDPCVFCEAAEETLDRVFFSYRVSEGFWSDLHHWLSLKMNDILTFDLSHILFYIDTLDSYISDMVNMIVLVGKYHIHRSKCSNSKPSFLWFINHLKLFFSSIKKGSIQQNYKKKV